MKLFTLLLTIICVLGYAMYAEGRLGSPAEIQRRRLSTYSYGGTTYNAGGYKANPSRSAQIRARNAGALTNSEARSMGLKNYRDEMDNDESVGWRGTAIKHGPRIINAIRTWGPVVKHCVSSMCGGDEMDNDESVGFSVGRPAYSRGNGRTYQSNGYTMNSRGYLANPSRSAQIRARNAGALTNSEARSMGLRNYRDEVESNDAVGVGLPNTPATRYYNDEVESNDAVGLPNTPSTNACYSGIGPGCLYNPYKENKFGDPNRVRTRYYAGEYYGRFDKDESNDVGYSPSKNQQYWNRL